jgi:hypothetical protein
MTLFSLRLLYRGLSLPCLRGSRCVNSFFPVHMAFCR